MYKFKLFYVANKSSESKIAAFKESLQTNMSEAWDLELIDVMEKPEIAAENNIFATPTLIRNLPEPVKKLIIDLSKLNDIVLQLTE